MWKLRMVHQISFKKNGFATSSDLSFLASFRSSIQLRSNLYARRRTPVCLVAYINRMTVVFKLLGLLQTSFYYRRIQITLKGLKCLVYA